MSGDVQSTTTGAWGADQNDLIERVGQIMRILSESMRELGLDREVEKAAQAIPDARDRINYVAAMTEQAAERALNAVDRAQPLQDSIASEAEALDKRWAEWFANPVALEDAKALVTDTRAYLADVPGKTQATQAQLMEILMAQDFQDLTGQVLKKMNEVIHQIEHQLIQVLLDSVPPGSEDAVLQRLAASEWNEEKNSLLNGPQIKPTAGEAVSGQAEVDALFD